MCLLNFTEGRNVMLQETMKTITDAEAQAAGDSPQGKGGS